MRYDLIEKLNLITSKIVRQIWKNLRYQMHIICMNFETAVLFFIVLSLSFNSQNDFTQFCQQLKHDLISRKGAGWFSLRFLKMLNRGGLAFHG